MIDDELCYYAENGDLEAVKLCIANGARDFTRAFISACKGGKMDVVAVGIPRDADWDGNWQDIFDAHDEFTNQDCASQLNCELENDSTCGHRDIISYLIDLDAEVWNRTFQDVEEIILSLEEDHVSFFYPDFKKIKAK